MKFRTAPVMAMLISLALLGSIWIAPSSSESIADPALLQALAEHFAGATISSGELIVGSLPDSLPPELLPIPNNAQILGSVVQGGHIRVVLDSRQPTSVIESFYEEQLLDAGWQLDRTDRVSWGITSAGSPEQFDGSSPPLFCSDTENATLRVLARGHQPGQPIEIWLRIIPNEVTSALSACSSNLLPTLPTLQLPEGVNMSSGSSSLGENSLYTDAVVEMSITSEALLSHLAEHFEQAGWEPVDRVEDDILSWASWTFESEQGGSWQGALNVIKLQGISDEYLVRVEAERFSLGLNPSSQGRRWIRRQENCQCN